MNALVDLPFALSPVTVGLACVLLFGTGGWFADFFSAPGIQIIFALPSMVLVTIFICIPFTIRELVPVLEEIGLDEEDASRTLGASLWQTFLRVTLPNIRWALGLRDRPHDGALDRRDRRRADRERPDQGEDRDGHDLHLHGDRGTTDGERYVVALVLAAISIVLLLVLGRAPAAQRTSGEESTRMSTPIVVEQLTKRFGELRGGATMCRSRRPPGR